MPFTVRESRDRVIPIAVCDLWGEEIQFSGHKDDGWLTGNAEWALEETTLKRTSEVYLEHKRCTTRLEEKRRRPNEIWETMELTHYIAQLLQSMNFSVDDLRSKIQQHPVSGGE
jgi:hypothetical protein